MEHLRARVASVVEHPLFQNAIIVLILGNAMVLALQTIPMAEAAAGSLLMWLDRITLWLFAGEIALRIVARGRAFFRDPWSVFDFTVVAVSFSALSGISALRAFRVFRILRLLNAFPKLRFVISGLLSALPGVTSVAVVLLIILFVASVIATQLFGAAAPQHFGDLFTSMFSLFQVMTLEGWPDIAESVLATIPYAWIFFVVFILVATLTMLNLFVAIIVGAMETEAQKAVATKSGQDDMLAELQAIRLQLARLEGAAVQGSGADSGLPGPRPGAAPALIQEEPGPAGRQGGMDGS